MNSGPWNVNSVPWNVNRGHGMWRG